MPATINGSSHSLSRGSRKKAIAAAKKPVYSRRRCTSSWARPLSGVHRIERVVQAASRARPPNATRPGVDAGSGWGVAIIAMSTTHQATIAATIRGRSKNPPENKRMTVGPPIRAAAPQARSDLRIGATLAKLAYTREGDLLAVRGGLIALSLLVLTWLALSYRAVGLKEDGDAAFGRLKRERGRVPAADVRRAQDDLRRAMRFGVSTDLLIDEGFLVAAAGKTDQAARIAAEATSDEPENLQAWFLSYIVARDEGAKSRVRLRVAELHPLAPDELDQGLR